MTRDVGPGNVAVFLLPMVTETNRCEEQRQQPLPGWPTAERAFRVDLRTFAQLPSALGFTATQRQLNYADRTK